MTNVECRINLMYSACRELLCRTVYFKKRLSKPIPSKRLQRPRANSPFEILRFACFKIDKAQRHQYSTFDVGRSMFDVQFFHCSGHLKFHTRGSEFRGFQNNLERWTQDLGTCLDITLNGEPRTFEPIPMLSTWKQDLYFGQLLMSSLLFRPTFTARCARDRRARRGKIRKGTIKIWFFSALSASSAVNTSFKS